MVQLAHLNSEAVATFMPLVFSNWQNEDEVKLHKVPWFTPDWLDFVWKYLRIHFNKDGDLSRFENLHLLKIPNSVVRKLSKQFPIISVADFAQTEHKLPAQMVKLCQDVGITVLEYSEMYGHPKVWNIYIQRPTAGGIMTALKRATVLYGIENLIVDFGKVSDENKVHFREFIVRGNGDLKNDDFQLLCKLPIMSKVDENGEKDSQLVSVADVQLGAPRDRKPNVPLPCPKVLLDLSDEVSFQLSKFLKIKLLSSEEILTEIYFPAVLKYTFQLFIATILRKQKILVSFMQYICRNLASFSTRVVRCASKVKFVSNRAGELHKPSDLYDKNAVATLFKEDDVFPDGEFAKPDYYNDTAELGPQETNTHHSNGSVEHSKESFSHI